MEDTVTVLSVRKYKAGYEVREEKVLTHWEDKPEGDTLTMKNAYTPNGDYIGNSRVAYRLCRVLGIVPEKSKPSHCVCSIGFSQSLKKWFGWSHRAIFGFEIGDTVKEGDCAASSGWTEEYLKDHPEENNALPVGFTAKTLEDAKKMAIAFAGSVS